MGISHKIISLMEVGHRQPTIQELCALSLIYGCDFEWFLADAIRRTRKEVAENFASLPDPPDEWTRKEARTRTLKALSERLEVSGQGV